MKKLVLGAVLMLMVSGVCSARSHDGENEDFRDHSPESTGSSGLGFALSAAFEFGGDKVATVLYTDNSTQSVNAGQGASISLGGHYRFDSPGLDIMATLGYKYVTTKASNANIYIGRVVPALEVSYYFTDSWWAGVGPVWHVNNEFRGGTLVQNLKFDTSMGVNLQAGWKYIALTYTNIKYTDQYKNKYDASNFGLMFVGRF